MDISIVEMLWNPLAGLTSWFGGWAEGLFEKLVSIFTILPTILLYGLQLGFFYIVDCVQTIFRKMAGLDTYYVDGQEQTGDIVMSMLTNQMIVNIFVAVLVVSIVLLFVTTFVAIIRVEFTEKGAGNAKGPIIGRAVKSLAFFIIVPVTCLFGIWVSNVFLRSFDQATSGNSYSLSTTIFFAAAQDANRARNNSALAKKWMENTELMHSLEIYGGLVTQEELAQRIDAAFLARTKISDTSVGTSSISVDTGSKEFSYYFAANLVNGSNSSLSFSCYDSSELFITLYFYDLFTGYNYLIGYCGGYFAAQLMISAVIGLIQRIYELAILFVISPAAVAFMPLDDGKKYQTWKGEFIKRVGMAYGPVIGLNLTFQILAVLQHFTMFPSGGFKNNLFNALVQLLFLIVGLLAIKELSSLISNFVGAEDAAGKGESKKADVKKMGAKMMAGQVAAARLGKDVAMGAVRSVRGRGAGMQDKKAADLRAEANKVRATDAKKAAKLDKKADEAEAKAAKKRSYREKHANDGLGAQFKSILSGDANKTAIGKSFGALSASVEPLKFFTRSAMAKRAEEGQSVFAQIPVWGRDKKTGKMLNLSDAEVQRKKAKEKDDKIEDAKIARGAEIEVENDQAFSQYAKEQGIDYDNMSAENKAAFREKHREEFGTIGGAASRGSLGERRANAANVQTAMNTSKLVAQTGQIEINTKSIDLHAENIEDKSEKIRKNTGTIKYYSKQIRDNSDATTEAVTGAYDDGSGGTGGTGGTGAGGTGGTGGGAGGGTGSGGGGGGGKFKVSVEDGQIEAKITEGSNVTGHFSVDGTAAVNVTGTPNVKVTGTASVSISSGGPLEQAMNRVAATIAAVGVGSARGASPDAIARGIQGVFRGNIG